MQPKYGGENDQWPKVDVISVIGKWGSDYTREIPLPRVKTYIASNCTRDQV